MLTKTVLVIYGVICRYERVLEDPETDPQTRKVVVELLVETRKRLLDVVLIAESQHEAADLSDRGLKRVKLVLH